MVFKGDFMGFSFNNIHSSSKGITRVSEGSRYTENLLPSFADKTVQVPGGDGVYFFSSNYTQRQFSVSVATDELTEKQFRELKEWLGDKEIHPLIFDETPYKTYMAKVAGTPSIKFLCFDNISEDNSVERVYKGEGTIQFICYYPYAICAKRFLSDYDNDNINEWAEASNIPATGTYEVSGRVINLFNAGDLETDFMVYFNRTSLSNLERIYIGNNILSFDFSENDNTSDTYIRINSKANLIEGCDENYEPTGTLYNKFIINGEFFKIPVGESVFNAVGADVIKLDYNYIYY